MDHNQSNGVEELKKGVKQVHKTKKGAKPTIIVHPRSTRKKAPELCSFSFYPRKETNKDEQPGKWAKKVCRV